MYAHVHGIRSVGVGVYFCDMLTHDRREAITPVNKDPGAGGKATEKRPVKHELQAYC